ncbi:hypothetical protein [Nostoc sp. UHCC 0870]
MPKALRYANKIQNEDNVRVLLIWNGWFSYKVWRDGNRHRHATCYNRTNPGNAVAQLCAYLRPAVLVKNFYLIRVYFLEVTLLTL